MAAFGRSPKERGNERATKEELPEVYTAGELAVKAIAIVIITVVAVIVFVIVVVVVVIVVAAAAAPPQGK